LNLDQAPMTNRHETLDTLRIKLDQERPKLIE
jgi:hypothetical protein